MPHYTATQNTSIYMHNPVKIWLVMQVMYKTFSKYSSLHWSLIYDYVHKNLQQGINTYRHESSKQRTTQSTMQHK
jgi:hypothetical protein